MRESIEDLGQIIETYKANKFSKVMTSTLFKKR